MVGKERLVSAFTKVAKELPRFTIICGEEKTGKRTFATQLARTFIMPFVVCETGVDDIREMITDAYKQGEKVVYVIPNIDTISNNAKNALLKIVEEPPAETYFIATARSPLTCLPTLVSRAFIFTLPKLTEFELEKYAFKTGLFTRENVSSALMIARTTTDLQILSKINIGEMIALADLIIKKIGLASFSNVLLLTKKLSFKDDEQGFPVKLFIQTLMSRYGDRRYSEKLVCMAALHKLGRTGANKVMIVDEMLLALREHGRK